MTAAPLVAGIVLTILGGVIRMRAWHAALADIAPSTRYRDVVVAHLGGAGFNGLVPAHGGDAVKLALLKRRVAEGRFGQLLGSLAPPAAVEGPLAPPPVALGPGPRGPETPAGRPSPLPLGWRP